MKEIFLIQERKLIDFEYINNRFNTYSSIKILSNYIFQANVSYSFNKFQTCEISKIFRLKKELSFF